MGMGRALMFAAEILAVAAVTVQFFLPTEMGITIYVGQKLLALPIRWVAPLLLISLAGALSFSALLAMYWRLGHIPVSDQ